MSLQETDAASAAVATAPRVSLASMETRIIEKHFVRLGDVLDTVHPNAQVTTLCVLIFDNGWVAQGYSSPASPENFNRELGEKFAYEDAIRKMWPMFGFNLRELIYTGLGK